MRDEFLQQRLQHLARVGLETGVDHGVIGVELITTGVEVGGVRRDTRQKIVKQGIDEIVNLGVVEREGTTWWLGAVVLVRHLLVGNNKIAVSKFNNANVTGHVDFGVDLNTAVDTVLENARKVGGRIDKAWVVGALLRQLRQ